MTHQNSPSQPIDIEWLAIKAGLKPANRVSVEPEYMDQVVARARREGLFVERAENLISFPGRSSVSVLYLSPEVERARALRDAEAPLLSAISNQMRVEEAVPLHTRLGEQLGFPSCCIQEFCVRLQRGVTRRLHGGRADEDFVAAESAAEKSQRRLGRLNDLASDRRARIVTFYPCRYDCPSAATYAQAVFDEAERVLPEAAQALRSALLGDFSIATDGSRGRAADLRGEVLTLSFNEF